MKKFIIIFVSIMTVIVTACIVGAIIVGINIGKYFNDSAYNYKSYKLDNVGLYYNEKSKKSFISYVKIDDENLNVELPSAYKDSTVNKLGGFYSGRRRVFYISYEPKKITNDYIQIDTSRYEDIKNEYEVLEEDITINIILPEKLEDIIGKEILYSFSQIYETYYSPDKKIYKFNITCKYSIIEKNKYFYTNDGYVYDKKTKELVD